MIGYIILTLIIVGLGFVVFFQMKHAKEAAEEGQQLLNDYQKRIDELQRLMDDYRDLQKNFDSVGTGYEQALLAFDKMEEEKQTLMKAKEGFEKQFNEVYAAKSTLEQSLLQKKELIQTAADGIKSLIDYATPAAAQIAQKANAILNLNDLGMETAIASEDNCQASDITSQAIRETGIDKATYFEFKNQIMEEAQATMLFTNQ